MNHLWLSSKELNIVHTAQQLWHGLKCSAAVIGRTKKPLRAGGVPGRSLVPRRLSSPGARQICDVPLSNVALSAMAKLVASLGGPQRVVLGY